MRSHRVIKSAVVKQNEHPSTQRGGQSANAQIDFLISSPGSGAGLDLLSLLRSSRPHPLSTLNPHYNRRSSLFQNSHPVHPDNRCTTGLRIVSLIHPPKGIIKDMEDTLVPRRPPTGALDTPDTAHTTLPNEHHPLALIRSFGIGFLQ